MTEAKSTKAADQTDAQQADAPADDDQKSDQVRVSLVSGLPGHRFVLPAADGRDQLVIDAAGVDVDRAAVEAIEEAARQSDVQVKVDEL